MGVTGYERAQGSKAISMGAVLVTLLLPPELDSQTRLEEVAQHRLKHVSRLMVPEVASRTEDFLRRPGLPQSDRTVIVA